MRGTWRGTTSRDSDAGIGTFGHRWCRSWMPWCSATRPVAVGRRCGARTSWPASLSTFSTVALSRLVRQAFQPNEALLGGTLLAANPLFIHYAPFVMTDIPTMLFLTVAAVAYLQARRRGGWLAHALAAASLAAAILAKYSAAAMLGGLGVVEVLRLLSSGQAAEGPAPGIGRRTWRLLKMSEMSDPGSSSPRPWSSSIWCRLRRPPAPCLVSTPSRTPCTSLAGRSKRPPLRERYLVRVRPRAHHGVLPAAHGGRGWGHAGRGAAADHPRCLRPGRRARDDRARAPGAPGRHPEPGHHAARPPRPRAPRPLVAQERAPGRRNVLARAGPPRARRARVEVSVRYSSTEVAIATASLADDPPERLATTVGRPTSGVAPHRRRAERARARGGRRARSSSLARGDGAAPPRRRGRCRARRGLRRSRGHAGRRAQPLHRGAEAASCQRSTASTRAAPERPRMCPISVRR